MQAEAKNQKADRGHLELNSDECKGCALCVGACPPKALQMTDQLNRFGYRPVAYQGHGCTGCGICFLVCPEPGGIRVLRLDAAAAA